MFVKNAMQKLLKKCTMEFWNNLKNVPIKIVKILKVLE